VAGYSLYWVRPDGSEESVSEHADFAIGWQAGTHVVTSDDKGGAYSLYSPSGIRVAKFGHARLTPHSGTDHTLMIDRVLELL
jgi:hypothetical protein